uniref:Uncharacterized protein n=1 Tax=Rhizophagus irregularis (strain DAOM 181602 / DAOM 197198 / MUCL 43194) TaxID=747089 RepID=U9TB92_RHIID
MNGKEFSNYPNDLNITWKDNKRTFHYKIMKAAFGNNFSNQVVSSKSSSDVTTLFHKQVNPEMNEASHSILTKRAKSMTKQVFNDFTNISKQYYNPEDKPLLKEV